MSKTTLFDSRIKKYAYREAAQIYKEIGASPDGLSREQVEEMREQYGANSFAERKNDTMVCRFQRAFINPFNVILFILGIISLVTDVLIASDFARNASTAIIIFTMILISGAIRLVQELRAKNAAQQLDRLIHESITVRRGGELIEIPAEKLVVGDIVLLSAGDRVPADIRLTSVTDLFISQAAITGESAILEKTCRTLSYSSPETLTQLENLVFMATTVISGKGEGIVLAVGKDTLYGSFAKPESEDKKSFQRGANSIAWVMLRFIAVLIPSVFVLLGVTGGNWLESFAFALSVAVGLMPEMLPMVITACLTRGSLSMSRKKTIIKDINAMQGFGSMDVLCMDKTGTLTNESILLEYYMDVLGNESGKVLDFAFLNSYFQTGYKNLMDFAIIHKTEEAEAEDPRLLDLSENYVKVDEIPFDFIRRRLTTVVQDKKGKTQMVTKGAVEEMLSICSYAECDGTVQPLTAEIRKRILDTVDDLNDKGFRVLAIAQKSNPSPVGAFGVKDECEMVLLGYLAFPRPSEGIHRRCHQGAQGPRCQHQNPDRRQRQGNPHHLQAGGTEGSQYAAWLRFGPDDRCRAGKSRGIDRCFCKIDPRPEVARGLGSPRKRPYSRIYGRWHQRCCRHEGRRHRNFGGYRSGRSEGISGYYSAGEGFDGSGAGHYRRPQDLCQHD